MIQYGHTSVLEQEFLSFFEEKQVKVFVDLTLGAGGHSIALLQKHPEIELLIGIDQDPSALAIAKERLQAYESKVSLVHANFDELHKVLQRLEIASVDGIFIDLGVSSMQLDRDERGFSFMREGPLDMRMNPEGDLTAEEIVNSWPERDLQEIFLTLGEERNFRRAAKAIVEARRKNRIETTTQLAEVISKALPRRGKLHPATLIFQALRLQVNRELDVIRSVLPQALSLLAVGGRLGVISFHSLEDRIVKETFRSAARENETLHILTKKPLVPSRQECRQNPRSRSAKLRFIEKMVG